MISLSQLLFAYLATAITGLALLAVNARNPVHSVLLVLAMFFHMAGLYLTLNAEFLAAVQIIVYAGAILVLYLFVVFLVNLKEEIRVKRFVVSQHYAILLAIGLCVLLVSNMDSFALGISGPWTIEAIQQTTHIKALGRELFTTYLLPFEITGLILLVAVIGGLVLAREDKATTKGNSDDENAETKGVHQ
ncbi:MAG: NADH-ubiquinone/plastoquinone oxidoreductase chain 6 [Desulfobulbaceae bacterium]|nr:MAG: NADH-ubiquinone/plastoquinone oxidoreductase chain 6 [Desulfobulbaceae bacterium]